MQPPFFLATVVDTSLISCYMFLSEIEYAERQNKPIIPIRVEAGIRPNGWLGIASGSKMVIDFSDPEKFTEKFQRLLKELAAKNIREIQYYFIN